MGKRYTKEEISQIQALVSEGFTDGEIASRLDRSENGVRNIRHRMNLKAKTHQSLKTLKQDQESFTKKHTKLRRDIKTLEARRQTVQQALNIEEQALNIKLQRALYKMKDEKPELFQITLEEQIGKMAAEVSVNLLRWLTS